MKRIKKFFEHKLTPNVDALLLLDPYKGHEKGNYKIVRFAFTDGYNAFALLDKKNKEMISYSITGNSEFKKFNEI